MHRLRKRIGALLLVSAATLSLALIGGGPVSATTGAHTSLTCSRYISNAGVPAISCTASTSGPALLHYIKGVDTRDLGLTFFANSSCAPPQGGLFLSATVGTGEVNPSAKFKVSVGLCTKPAIVDIYKVDQEGNVAFVRSNTP